MKILFIRAGILFVLSLMVAVITVSADEDAVGKRVFVPAIHYANTPCHVTVNAGQSIQSAINSTQSGQTICVRAGTYHENIRIANSKSGITVMAYPGERPVIDGRHTLPATQYEGLVRIAGSGVTFDGFEVRNSAHRGVLVGRTTTSSPQVHDVVVRNLIITGSMNSGINVNGTVDARPRNVLIENNVVHSNLLKNTGKSIGGSAVSFVGAENSIARGNHVYHNRGEGVVSDRWSIDITIEDNVVYDNRAANIYLINTERPLVQRNLVFCTDNRDYWLGSPPNERAGDGLIIRDEAFSNLSTRPGPSSGQVIINNIVVGCGTNFHISSQIPGGGLNNGLVANNTFVNAQGDNRYYVANVKFESRASYKNSRFVNNLMLQSTPGNVAGMAIIGQQQADLSTFTMANNLYSTQPGKNWPANETGRLIIDPKLANPVRPQMGSLPDPANYRITAASPAINAGLGVDRVVTDFFQRNRTGAPDIGAFEFAP